MTEYNVAMSDTTHGSLADFLLKNLDDEEICFASWFPALGKKRTTGLISSVMLPANGDRVRHGNVSVLPAYVDRVKEEARLQCAGLAMIHTHPMIGGWQGVSEDDLYYERDVLAREVYGITGLPFIGMTLARNRTWSARFYPVTPGKGASLEWCSAVRIVGKNLVIQYNPRLRPPPPPNDMQMRSSSVWGPLVQAELARMRIGVIGAGSVGSLVCETLARIGVGEVYVVDYDRVKVHNLDRTLYASKADVGKLKADVVNAGIVKSATAQSFASHAFSSVSIVEEDGYRLAKDCDALFSCVDRPWPRQVLNHLAYACLIPVVDGGVTFKFQGPKLIHGMFRAQTVGPSRACMNCLGAIDAGEVQMDREGLFDDPDYIEGLKKIGAEPSRQNIMPFSIGLASLETVQFVELMSNLARKGDLGQQAYDYYTAELLPELKHCALECEYPSKVGRGDRDPPFLAKDISKGRQSEKRQAAERPDRHGKKRPTPLRGRRSR